MKVVLPVLVVSVAVAAVIRSIRVESLRWHSLPDADPGP